MSARWRRYDVTISVTVTDPRIAIKAARDRAEESLCSRGTIRDTKDAVHWLLDPGSMFEQGIEIDGSSVEETE